MLIILVLIGSAAACGIMAKKKGRSVIGYAILGFVFGLFGVLFTALVPPKRDKRNG